MFKQALCTWCCFTNHFRRLYMYNYIYMYGFGSIRAMIVNGPCGDPLYPKRKLGREVGCLNTIFFRNMNPEEIPF